MITQIPTSNDFENIGLECLIKSIEMLYSISTSLQEINDQLEEESIEWADFWKYHHVNLRASLILAYQGVEYLMKSRISMRSSLLLIQNNPTTWPSFPNSENKSFEQLQTISGEQLIRVFYAVTEKEFFDTDFESDFEKLRIKRNKLVHSASAAKLTVKYILKTSIKFIDYYFGQYSWRTRLFDQIEENPTFDLFDAEFERAYNFQVLNFLKRELGKGQLNSFIELNIKSRKYYCPSCTYDLSKYDSHSNESKWAFLDPNQSSSTSIMCLACSRKFDVKRDDCKGSDCKGNVINDTYDAPICLTCYCEQ